MQLDRKTVFIIGYIVGVLIITGIFFVSGAFNQRTVLHKEEDGSAYICNESQTFLVKDAESDTWLTPTGLLASLCK